MRTNNKLVFGTMNISECKKDYELLNMVYLKINSFHVSSEYKSFKIISSFLKKKKQI